mgnify:FL=1
MDWKEVMAMILKSIWTTLKQGVEGFIDDDVFTLAAALAFYAMLSVAPLLVLLVTVLGLLPTGTQERITQEATSLVGPGAGDGVEMLLRQAAAKSLQATVSTAASLAIVLLTATTVFARLQYSLNRIFNVRRKQGFLKAWLYKRALSLLMVVVMGILLVASVVISSIVSTLFSTESEILPMINFAGNLILYMGVFVIMLRVLPDVRMSWKDTWFGGLVCAGLFLLGNYGISMYFSRAAPGSVYGAAGSLVVLLLWIFYSSVIIFFGAELTQAYGRCCDQEIVPSDIAEWDPVATVARDEGERRREESHTRL